MNFRDRLQSRNVDILGPIKTFENKLLSFPEYPVDETGHRKYIIDGMPLPSVTTILGATQDKAYLDDWKERIGETEANKITTQSARRGTVLHKICQEYLLNNPDYLGNPTPVYFDLFRQIKPLLDEHVDAVFGIEALLFSKQLKVAGRTDCLASYRKKIAIVDFKNARYEKQREDIEGYFIQAAMYARMVMEMKKVDVPKIVVLIAVAQGKPLEYIEDRKDWDGKVDETIAKYYEEN